MLLTCLHFFRSLLPLPCYSTTLENVGIQKVCLQTKCHPRLGRPRGSFWLLSLPLAFAKPICLIIQLPHWARARFKSCPPMTSPPSSTTARWSFNFRLGGGLWAVNWNALPRSLLSVGVLRSRTAQPASAVGFVWTGRGARERGRVITPVPSQWNYTAIAAVYMELLFFVFLVSVSHIFTYVCPRKFAWFLLSIKKWLGTTRHRNPNVYSVTRSSNICACQPAKKNFD